MSNSKREIAEPANGTAVTSQKRVILSIGG
jgi:hypothetical protein